MHREVPGEDERLAVVRDARRPAALAEPVVFDELIVPSSLNGIVTRDEQRAVHILGQPGAGKLLAARMARRAMRPGRTRPVGDDFKVQRLPTTSSCCATPPAASARRSARTAGHGSPGPTSVTGAATS
ncbi:hypothetical protein [Streptomyces sp. F-1]|uniref:hypothetical protein n=1 Tax=Streptomyces sp. F-1 TaxID=463642 RepID=UPI00085C4371|nr:hypothetical protein [Streptomyces sp. F-1]SFY51165.1 hypothetical protein STEPF1_04422 [Streptomyces sp. F-1]